MLVTRPRRFAAGLARAVEEAGGRVSLCPALEILEPVDPRCLAHLGVTFLGEVAVSVFVSRSAVEWVLRLAPAPRTLARIPALAPGPGTAALLRRRGFRRVVAPNSGIGSEALLAVEELAPANIAGTRVLLFRGQGGRALLPRELRRRGAQLHCLEVYRRALPRRGGHQLKHLLQEDPPDLAIVTSGDALRNLWTLGEALRLQKKLRRLPLLVPGPRLAALARSGLDADVPLSVAAGADDAGLLQAIQLFYRKLRPRPGSGFTQENKP